MNSSHKPPTPSSFSSYQFDFGFVSSSRNASKPLKEQQSNPTAPAPASVSQPNIPSWTHQPVPTTSNLAGPTSMAGDIFGKSWNSTAASSPAMTASIGIPKSNPNMFGDLVGSALNQGKNSNNNFPLKVAPARNSYSMGNLADSLLKSNVNGGNSMRPSWGSADNVANIGGNNGNSSNLMKSSWGSADNFGNFSSSQPIGGQPMKSMPGTGSNPNGDPFRSLMNSGSKKSGNPPNNSSNTKTDSSFGSFQNVKSADFGIPAQKPMKTEDYSFGDFRNVEKNDFGIPLQSETNQQSSDLLNSLFSSSKNSVGISASQQFGEMNDWDVGSEFGGQDHSVTTTELEGLPPPPSGVTSLMAKSKGMDNYKQGQYADAIKWLSWAAVLIDKNGDGAEGDEVLTCRASCYKEVGEYKKAVADCSKVLEHDSTNVSVLLQRALLYESTEKYKLGADDLRMVLKIDPGNRLAKSTIHRLNKIAG